MAIQLDLFQMPAPSKKYDNVIGTWQTIEKRLYETGCPGERVHKYRTMFAAGIYAASRDVLMNRADSRSLSEDAQRLEDTLV
jgi:hypothetical protein